MCKQWYFVTSLCIIFLLDNDIEIWPQCMSLKSEDVLIRLFDGFNSTCINFQDVSNGVATISAPAKLGPFNVTVYHKGGTCSDDTLRCSLYVFMGIHSGHFRMRCCMLKSVQDIDNYKQCNFICYQNVNSWSPLHFVFLQWFMNNPGSDVCEIEITQ